jgi:Kef-type K+ transport system membrane component KefB
MASLITSSARGAISTGVAIATSVAAHNATRVAPQGGIIEGENPTQYKPKDPIILFIIQAGIIIIFCRLLHYPLSLMRQPRVIAEVIGGILLGPTVFGRIPNFTNTIFPADAMPNLTLVANLGLLLFLFLVGLEVDVRFLTSNWKIALSVGVGGMALPFGLGCGIAWGLYKEFPATTPISFGVFCLFVGVAMAITAFPVLCRILTELKLLNTPVGIIVLSAGVGNDVVGWILLALCVALVNAGTGLSALWVLLTAVAWTLFLVFAVRPVILWILVRTRSIQDGPSQSIIALTLLLTLTSAFFTGVIGVHPIFGAFMIGIICPHDGGFAIKVTEKVEDLISALFLPLYFALSGLSTNLGLLNSALVWGYVIGIIAVAFCGKFIGASVAAKLCGLVWRESFAIGSLMSCKGLVELIVLVSLPAVGLFQD